MANEKWYNEDGLVVRFGNRDSEVDNVVPSQSSTMGKEQELIIIAECVDIPLTDATSLPAGAIANAARLPAGAVIQSVRVVTKVAAASGGAADLIIGNYGIAADGTLALGDADSIFVAGDSALTDFSVAGETVETDKSSTAVLVGKVEVGADSYVAASVLAAVYTAGQLQICIKYTV